MPFPWPRETYGKAISYLKHAGAKAVIFDFLFTSRSPWGEEDDLALAKAARAHGMAIAGFQIVEASQPEALKRFEDQQDLYSLPLEGEVRYEGEGVDAPYPPIWGGFAGLGDVNFEQDSDGISRRARLFGKLNDKPYGSLAFTAAWLIDGKPKITKERGRILMGAKEFALDRGQFQILYRKPKVNRDTNRLIDLVTGGQALEEGDKPQLNPSRFKDKIVIIGSNAPGLLDLRPSPLDKRAPGVTIQANILDNLLSGQNLKVLRMSWWMWILLYLVVNVLAKLSHIIRGLAAQMLPYAFVSVAAVIASVWAYDSQNTLLPTALILVAVLITFVSTAAELYILEQRQRSRVQGVFGQFLSPAVLKQLTLGGGMLGTTGGETKNLAVFFSDLAGFTSFSEKLSPEALVEILNTYLEEMAEVVVGKHDGYVDKYIGDAIMAIWGAPTEIDNPALSAAEAAWDCQRRLAEIQEPLKELGLDAGEEGLVMRIGINYGPCVVGLMGSRRKLNYTVMGDTVNTASRLEGANKPYGTRIMLSESARDACGTAILVRVLDFLTVKGKTEPTKVFELIGIRGQPGALYEEAYVIEYHAALDLYKAREFAKAKAKLEGLVAQRPKDSLAKVYIHRCEEYVAHPPEAGWDGVYVLKTK